MQQKSEPAEFINTVSRRLRFISIIKFCGPLFASFGLSVFLGVLTYPIVSLIGIACTGVWLFYEYRRYSSQDFNREAGKWVDDRFNTKERALSFVELQTDDEKKGLSALVGRQLGEKLPLKPEIDLPIGRSSLICFLIGFTCLGAALWLEYGSFATPINNAQEVKKIEDVIKENPELPEEVQASLKNLAHELSAHDIDSEEVGKALDAAEAALESIEKNAASTSVVGADEENKSKETSPTPTPTVVPTNTPTPTATPTKAAEEKESENKDKKENKEQQQQEESKSGQGEGKGQGDGESQGDSDQQQGKEGKEKSEGQGKGSGDKKEKNDGQGSGESKGEGKNEGQQAVAQALSDIREKRGEKEEGKEGKENKEGKQGEGQGKGSKEQTKKDDKQQGKGEGKGKQESNELNEEKSQSGKSGDEPKESEEKGDKGQQNQSENNDKEKKGNPKDVKGEDGMALPKEDPHTIEELPRDGSPAPGLGDKKAFKDVAIGDQKEIVNAGGLGATGEVVKHDKEAKEKVQIRNVPLPKPEIIKEGEQQEVPLEYKNILR